MIPAALLELSAEGRRAIQKGDWLRVRTCGRRILERDPRQAEGQFFIGLAAKAEQQGRAAIRAFESALELDGRRHDAAIELALQYAMTRRHGEACRLLGRFEGALANSPVYLNLAGTVYSMLGMHDRAYPLFSAACELQPGADILQASLASCSVYMGRLAQARSIYRSLLDRFPDHQRNHYQLSRIQRAKDAVHVDEMKAVLERTRLPPERNIFLYYALGKELEDLERWDEAFEYYRQAGDTIKAMGCYDVSADVDTMRQAAESCTPDWLADRPAREPAAPAPIFVVGLPRTGTTLVERILSSHSGVASLDETRFLEWSLQEAAGRPGAGAMSADIIRAAAQADAGTIGRSYLEAAAHRLGPEPRFIDKLPENVIYAGFIAKCFPAAGIVHLRRGAMDACFAMYKQSYFKFAYSLEDLARYYVAYHRLVAHWRVVLGSRWVEVDYEAMVGAPEAHIRTLLDRLGLPFEPGCLAFEKNPAPSATASAAQVREKMHTGSIGRWKHFARQLEPMRRELEQAGIETG